MTTLQKCQDKSQTKWLCFKIQPALPSLNEIYSLKKNHWSTRHKLEKQWLEIVGMNLRAHLRFNKIPFDPKRPLFEGPVKITICNYAPKPVDPDNVYGKVAIDALKGILIANDTANIVIGGVHYYSYSIKRGTQSFSSICVESVERCSESPD